MPGDSAPRRRFRRRTVRVRVDYQSRDGAHCDVATTLGAGGLFIESRDPLPEGTRLTLRFRLPEGGVVHEFEGRVAWRHRADGTRADPRPAGMGIAFSRAAATGQLARELEALDD